MRFFKTSIYFLLSIVILSLGGLAHAKNGKENMKHRGMDQNNDRVITRGEWRGNDKSFGQHDKNGDGVLSGDEVNSGEYRRLTRVDRFVKFDRNNDGVISREEFNTTNRSFDGLDRNHNGQLDRDEFYYRKP